MTANPDFKKKFTSKLELPVFINDELVTFGQTYAKENGYKLDDCLLYTSASCQKVLGGWANIANEYATKRYRSNLINWGMLPFITKEDDLSLIHI